MSTLLSILALLISSGAVSWTGTPAPGFEFVYAREYGDAPGTPYYGLHSVRVEGNHPDGGFTVVRFVSTQGGYWFVIDPPMPEPYASLAEWTMTVLNGDFDAVGPNDSTPEMQAYRDWLIATSIELDGCRCLPDDGDPPVYYGIAMPLVIR